MNHPRDPSTLFFQKDYVRRSIIAAYWLIIILAVPLWWRTTSIERLPLPYSRVARQALHHLSIPITIEFDEGVSIIPAQLQRFIDDLVEKEPQRWEGLEVKVRNTTSGGIPDETYTIVAGNEVSIHDRQLIYPTHTSTVSELAETLASLFVPSFSTHKQDHRVAPYSPRYRLSFTLLNEDSASGGSYLDWSISDALLHHISPILAQIQTLHNFTIESQVQYHAPLAFSPKVVENGFGITPEDLTVFVNSAEWTLSSSASDDPVLHFVVFVPSPVRRPIFLLDDDGSSTCSTSFLLPQWGSIMVLNPPDLLASKLTSPALDSVFSAFSRHLLSLLGVPLLPSNVRRESESGLLSEWQLDAFLRYRALSNTRASQDTLGSIVNLVNQIENMPVGPDVREDIQGALFALEEMFQGSKASLLKTFHLSTRALTLSSRAFFHPGMLALLYFPAEHKYAVYTPLFASGVIPLFIAALKELRLWKEQRIERSNTYERATGG